MSERVRGAIDLAPAPGPDSLALDISAGDGLSSRMLAERGWRVVSTERRTPRPGWVAADLNNHLPFRSARFDLVLMLEVIEHLADIPHALAELARVTRPGGVAVIRVGAATEVELTERKHRIEDAVRNAKAAVEEGLLPGGGVALGQAPPPRVRQPRLGG